MDAAIPQEHTQEFSDFTIFTNYASEYQYAFGRRIDTTIRLIAIYDFETLHTKLHDWYGPETSIFHYFNYLDEYIPAIANIFS